MPLKATADPGHHHFASETVHFYMNDGDRRVRCGISSWRWKSWNPSFPQQRKAVCRRSISIDDKSSGLRALNLTEDNWSRTAALFL